jgi:hypothetical protein
MEAASEVPHVEDVVMDALFVDEGALARRY